MLVGIDACEKKRFKKLINNKAFLERYFTEYEVSYANDVVYKELRLAGIYSAKEAFLKAVGLGVGREISLKDIEVKHNDLGKPYLNLTTNAKNYLQKLNITQVEVSITHTSTTSIAVVILN